MKKILFFAILLPLLAHAEGSPVSDVPPTDIAVTDSSRVYDLDAVVVVAQPKEQFRLRQQPLSSTLFAADDLHGLRIGDLRDLSLFVPSFTMPRYGSRYTSSIYVRGIGSRLGSSPVGMYVDGMPLVSNAQYNFHFYQMDRVDVLRGPQGTLYGMNAEGGLVRMYTHNPFDNEGFDIRLGGGTHGFRTAELSANKRLSDRLALSAASYYEGSNGFFRNSTTGRRADGYDEAGARLRLMFNATERLSFDLLADYQHTSQDGFPYGLLDASGSVAAPSSNRQSTYRRNMLNTALSVKYALPGFDIHSTTSYQHLHDNMLMDIDYSPADLMHMEQRQKMNALTEELTFKSNNPSQRWQWTSGAFFSYKWLDTNAPVTFHDAFNNQMAARLNIMIPNLMMDAMIRGGMPAAAAKATVAAMKFNMYDFDMGTVPGEFRTPQLNFGLFHESNISITSKLKATLGLRYDLSRQFIDYTTSAQMTALVDMMVKGAPATIPYNISSALSDSRHSSFDQLLPKFGLTLDVDGNGSNIYASVSKGYRAGGYNIQNFSDIFQKQLSDEARSYSGGAPLVVDNSGNYDQIVSTISYEPETSWNYELGTHLNLFDGSLHLDLAAYYITIRNQQLSQMAAQYAFGRSMVNAGRSTSLGFELAARGRAFDNRLGYGLSYGFTHATFREYDDTVDDIAVSYRGKHVPYIPMHTFAATADWTFTLNNMALKTINLGADVTAQGSTYWDNANTRAQGFTAQLGAHLGLDFGRCGLRLWGRNITNTRYTTFAFQYGSSATSPFYAQPGIPAEGGIDLSIHF